MADAWHYFGGDLAASAGGDILAVTVPRTESEQRLLRRYFTSEGEYLWHREYGAGLGERVGDVASERDLSAIVTAQTLLEDGIAKFPPAQSSVVVNVDGTVTIRVVYLDISTGTPAALTFDINR